MTTLAIEKYRNWISPPTPAEHRQNGGVFLKGTRTRKKVQAVLKLEVKCMPQRAPESWHPSEDSTPADVPDGSSLCTHSHFLPLARKMLPEGQERCTANRGLELGNLKTKQKISLWRREEREQNLARSENTEWIFTSFSSSSKNLKLSALYKPRTCSNSSFVDFPDNRAAESHLIHLWDLVRTGKYNRLQNTWNCWHREHFLPNSVGQQTQSRPCNYIPPWSTFAVV